MAAAQKEGKEDNLKGGDDLGTTPRPKEGQCAFYIPRKKRFCRFRPHHGQKYCAEHAIIGGVVLKRKRVQCPLNSKHTCYEDQLNRHLKKCRKISKNLNVYYEEGINAGESEEGDITSEKLTLKTASKDEILSLVEKVNRLHAEYVGELPVEELMHESLRQELSTPSYGFKVLRQRKQQASLIGHLERRGFLKDGLCYAELGAGRGQLAHWVQLALNTCDNSSFVLVDKGTCRYKFDSFHRGEHQGPTFERLQVNLSDINLGKVPSIREGGRPVLGLGKHLCGDATDLALRCLTQTLSLNDQESTRRPSLHGVAIALCCHHRCTWRGYVGKRFLRDQCGFSPKDFQLLTSIASWATCSWEGWKKHVPKTESNQGDLKDTCISEGSQEDSRETNQYDGEVTQNKLNNTLLEGKVSVDDIEEEHTGPDRRHILERQELGLTVREKEVIGRKCKQLIDRGRVIYLHDNHMTAELMGYIDESYTPENIVLLSTPICPSS